MLKATKGMGKLRTTTKGAFVIWDMRQNMPESALPKVLD
jgi:hypothetical protein